MKAIRYYGPGNLKVENMPQPEISSGEVLVRVNTCGICATDVKTYRRGHPKIQPGSVLGHEIAGQIAAVKDVEGWVVGQRVVVAPYTPCGECDHCQRGHFTTCDHLMEEGMDPGGFAEYVRVPPRLVRSGLMPIPESLADTAASFTEPVACCIHGLEAMGLESRDSLLIVGDGPMGIIQALVARVMGVQRIVLSGANPGRLALAAELVDCVIDARQPTADDQIRKALPQGADKVIVSVGDPAAAENALRYARKSGSVNFYAGLPKDARISVDPYLIHYDEVRLMGTFGFAPSHFRKALEYLSNGLVDPKRLISSVVDFDHIQQALEDAAAYRGIKFVLQFP